MGSGTHVQLVSLGDLDLAEDEVQVGLVQPELGVLVGHRDGGGMDSHRPRESEDGGSHGGKPLAEHPALSGRTALAVPRHLGG